VEELHVPYVFPQECGGRTGVRWLHLGAATSTPAQQQQPSGPGLLISAAAAAAATPGSSSGAGGQLHMNVSRFSWQALAGARHQHELTPDPDCLHLHLDAAHMGVGGDDSWSPSVLPEYLVPPGRYSLSVGLTAVPAGTQGTGLAAAARQLRHAVVSV
jgi:hypothetical protein